MQNTEKSFIHVYTGNGKGKTTAAIGLAVRCVGAGYKVYFCQFLKGGNYSETKVLSMIDGIKHETFGMGGFIRGLPTISDLKIAEEGFLKLKEAISSGIYRLVIADEIIVAVHKGVIKKDELLKLLSELPDGVELVLTGRYADDDIKDSADLVTEMLEVKHYFSKGVQARIGIEK